MSDKLKIIRSLITFDEDKHSLESKLRTLEWDFLGTPEILTLKILQAILKRWQNSELSDDDIIWWSNAIECRDHIDFEPDHDELISESIFKLANAEINHVGPHAELMKEIIQIVDKLEPSP